MRPAVTHEDGYFKIKVTGYNDSHTGQFVVSVRQLAVAYPEVLPRQLDGGVQTVYRLKLVVCTTW
eukprot:COSAG01_NODE_6632_length_3567_cov_1.835206_1_plen_65_part_00